MNIIGKTIRTNVDLWRRQFWAAWEPLPLDVKLIWIAFITQTLGVITLIELFVFKK